MLDTLTIKNQGMNKCVFEMNQGSSLSQYRMSFTMEKLDKRLLEEVRVPSQLDDLDPFIPVHIPKIRLDRLKENETLIFSVIVLIKS